MKTQKTEIRITLLSTAAFGISLLLLLTFVSCGKKETKAPETKQTAAKEIVDSSSVLVEGGSFLMGSTGEANQKPARKVTLSSYYIGKYETTIAEFKKFIDDTKYVTIGEKQGFSLIWNGTAAVKKDSVTWRENENGKTAAPEEFNKPVVNLCWYDIIEYANWKSKKDGLTPVYTIDKTKKDTANKYESTEEPDIYKWTVVPDWNANGYRLPTEAEWEFAARGGTKSKGYTFSGSNTALDVAWTKEIGEDFNHAVGMKKPNELGLYDMSGNVWEWCWDWYTESFDSAAVTDPRGPASGTVGVLRGGSWYDLQESSTVTARIGIEALRRGGNGSFRLVRNAK